MDVTLTTTRLTLRQPRLDDAPRLARLLNNFAVSGNLARVPYPYGEAEALGWIHRWRPDTAPAETGFTLDLPGEGLIGHCGFHLDRGRPVIGYWVGEPFWNRGFMSEAADAALGWYFDVTGADHVRSGVFAFNRASLAVQRKLGFTQTGESRMLCLARGEEVRHIDTRLARADFLARRADSARALASASSRDDR